MTPDQAYDILKEVAEKYQGTFQDHCAMQTALRVIFELLPQVPEVTADADKT